MQLIQASKIGIRIKYIINKVRISKYKYSQQWQPKYISDLKNHLYALKTNQRQSSTWYFQLLASIYYRTKESNWHVSFKLHFSRFAFEMSFIHIIIQHCSLKKLSGLPDSLCHAYAELCVNFPSSPCACLWCEVRFRGGMNLAINHFTSLSCRRID